MRGLCRKRILFGPVEHFWLCNSTYLQTGDKPELEPAELVESDGSEADLGIESEHDSETEGDLAQPKVSIIPDETYEEEQLRLKSGDNVSPKYVTFYPLWLMFLSSQSQRWPVVRLPWKSWTVASKQETIDLILTH